MTRYSWIKSAWILLALAAVTAAAWADVDDKPAAPTPSYSLIARRKAGDRTNVTVSYEVGGELVVPADEGGTKKLPMSVAAEFAYREALLSWSADAATPTRSLRDYATAKATIKTDQQGIDENLAADRRLVVAELQEHGQALAGLGGPLTRQQFDLLDVPATTLAVDRLLPGRKVQQGEHWDHDSAAIAPLLGMDHVAVCEVRSVATGEQNGQVQIRLAGGVQGTIDGAPTEINLRAAYLYSVKLGRVVKFNMAIEEHRDVGEATPGVDAVSKLSLTATAAAAKPAAPFDKKTLARAAAPTSATLRELVVDAPTRGYRFRHDSAWFVTGEARELMTLRLVRDGELLARCSLQTRPPRTSDKPMDLKQFEGDIVESLGKKLDKVEAATEWETAAGVRCLGVVAEGEIDEAPIEWRYYYLAAPQRPQVSIAVTVDKSLVERLANADKSIVESLELVPLPAKTEAKAKSTKASPATAAKPVATSKR